MTTEKERQQMLYARELIREGRIADARVILKAVEHHPTAQRWIAQLDAMGLGMDLEQGGAAPVQAGPVLTEAAAQADRVARIPRVLVSAIVMIVGLLMVVGFFVFPWMNLGDMSFFGMSIGAFAESFSFGGEVDMDTSELEVTAMELWMGQNNGENFTLDLTNPEGGGVADVRLLDRLLIGLPVLALVLIWFTWNYASGIGSRVGALSAMSVLALVLLIAPLAWESLSEQQIEDSMNDSLRAEMSASGADLEGLDLDFGGFFGAMFSFKEAYSTGEQQLLGGLALGACALGWVVEFMALGQRPSRSPA